jgi:hypothetical protein
MTTTAQEPSVVKETVTLDNLPELVYVTALSTLHAGYVFEAEINGDSTKMFVK